MTAARAMQTDEDRRKERIGAEASRWIVRASEKPLSEAEALELRAWLDADPEHERQYRTAEAGWQSVPHLKALDDIEELMKPTLYQRFNSGLYDTQLWFTKHSKRPASWAVLGTTAAAMAAFAFVISNFSALAPDQTIEDPARIQIADIPVQVEQTQTAEIREITLDDGSVITLGAESQVDVQFSETERRVNLIAGEAFFDVEGNPDRPFIVVADTTLVRVVGTRFDVSLGTELVDVTVEEGRVEILQPEIITAALVETDITHVLTAGQRVSAPKIRAVVPVETVSEDDIAVWRNGEIYWIDTPMADVVADLNRYAEFEIVIGSEGLAAEPVTMFRLDATDVRGAVKALAEGFEDVDLVELPSGDVELR